MEQAGFDCVFAVEMDSKAVQTLEHNRSKGTYFQSMHVVADDARTVQFPGQLRDNVDLLTAGASCQPFSVGGKHEGALDDRDVFPAVFRAIRELRPRAIVLENVKGLLRARFKQYFDYILAQLEDPGIESKPGETWQQHSDRLRKLAGSRAADYPRYRTYVEVVNAADFGIPQQRERIFIIALREDVGHDWRQLRPTYSLDALVHEKYVSGCYWARHDGWAEPTRKEVSRLARWVPGSCGGTAPWRTVADALEGLPDPRCGSAAADFTGHGYVPGARSYPGHTGSTWHLPAKTIKAGVHGVPGGENMLRDCDGSVRYFTTRELARMQTFPDDFEFPVSWATSMRQIGNAVPVLLNERLGLALAKCIGR